MIPSDWCRQPETVKRVLPWRVTGRVKHHHPVARRRNAEQLGCHRDVPLEGALGKRLEEHWQAQVIESDGSDCARVHPHVLAQLSLRRVADH